MLKKSAIQEVPQPCSPGFFSTLFLVPKPNNKWRPVIDLSSLNLYITAPSFRMETVAQVRASIRKGDFAVSLDLTDAYFHIPINKRFRKYLRFAIDGKVYAFKALPFGLNLSPWVFTRVMDSVISVVRQRTQCLTSNYLDDILQKLADRHVLAKDLAVLRSLLRRLGFKVNLEKSDLVPSQSFVHLGMFFQTHLDRVSLPQKRIDKILASLREFLSLLQAPPRQIHGVLSQFSAAADLVPLGRLRLRPVQREVKLVWSQATGDWDSPVPLPPSLLQAFASWLDPVWLSSGVPLTPPSPAWTLCVDASSKGWGAHLTPPMLETSGLWSPEESLLHVNILELQAVSNALRHWLTRVSGSTILVRSDNTTVVAYLRNQGGTHSHSLSELACSLLSWCFHHSMTLVPLHIPGHLNVLADALSRRSQLHLTEWSLHQSVFEALCSLWGRPHIDLFATRLNHKLPTFVSPFPDPLAYAVDSLSIPWTGMFAYAFPPPKLVPLVLKKLESEQCLLILVTPFKWSKPWTNQLCSLLVEPPRLLPVRWDLLRQPRAGAFHSDPKSLALHGVLLSSRLSEKRQTSALLSWKESSPDKGVPL